MGTQYSLNSLGFAQQATCKQSSIERFAGDRLNGNFPAADDLNRQQRNSPVAKVWDGASPERRELVIRDGNCSIESPQ